MTDITIGMDFSNEKDYTSFSVFKMMEDGNVVNLQSQTLNAEDIELATKKIIDYYGTPAPLWCFPNETEEQCRARYESNFEKWFKLMNK